MKNQIKKNVLLILLVVSQCLAVKPAFAEDIVIPQQIFKCVGGTVVIKKQNLHFEEGNQPPQVMFEVVDVHPMIRSISLYSKTLGKFIEWIMYDEHTYYSFSNTRIIDKWVT